MDDLEEIIIKDNLKNNQPFNLVGHAFNSNSITTATNSIELIPSKFHIDFCLKAFLKYDQY